MIKIILPILLSLHPLSAFIENYCDLKKFDNGIVEKTKMIEIPGIDCGFNPSMVPYGDKILMAIRHQPPSNSPWVSYVVLAFFDKEFRLCGELQTLDLRKEFPDIPSYAEDPRLLWVGERLFLVYNDNLEGVKKPTRREMYLVELIETAEGFEASAPVLLKHPTHYPQNAQEKNWVPFDYEGQLLLGYTLNPHEVLQPDCEEGFCARLCQTHFTRSTTPFNWGTLRGGTPAVRIGDQYLAFFHSSDYIYSNVSKLKRIPHYFCGAYTFSSEPPFAVQALSPHPIVGRDFYSTSHFYKRVVYPAGFFIQGNRVYLCFGKDDRSLCVAILNLKKLLASLIPVEGDD